VPDLAQITQISAAHAWFYLPVAVVLGALHALEPGHAKSLIAVYIVAIRSGQAALLGFKPHGSSHNASRTNMHSNGNHRHLDFRSL
jgi:ABC-type nickel/cobalt efflux system permease component RcnA